MASGDLSDAMVTRVRQRLGEWATAGLSDAEVFAALNEGQIDIAWKLPDAALRGIMSSATGSLTASAFTLPTDFMRFRTLTVATVYATYWPVSKVMAMRGIAAASAKQPFCTIWGSTCTVYVGAPTSTAAYALQYIAEPTTITTSVDPVYDAYLLDLIETFAVESCLRLRQRTAEADEVLARYNQALGVIDSRYPEGPLHEGKAVDPGG